MKILLILILCFCILFLVWVFLISFKMSEALSVPEYKTYETTIGRAKNEEHCYDDFDTYEKEPFDLTLRDGYVIHGDYYPLDPDRVVIISHGHGDNKYTGIRFLQLFRKLGYSAVIYDLRGHGHNEPYVCTMGLNESKDLMELIGAVKKRFPGARIGLHGLSMGCATTVMALKYHPDVDFVIADCGYGILRELCKDKLRSVGAPRWMYAPVNRVNRMRYGYDGNDVNPIDSLNNNEIPICFIHGTGDKLISYHQSEWMFERNKGAAKELHLVPGAAHAHAWIHDPEAYEQIVRDFITDNVPVLASGIDNHG